MILEMQRKTLIERFVNELLMHDQIKYDYEYTEKMWEASGLSNKDLVDELLANDQNENCDFKKSIFGDMLLLLRKKIMQDDALRSLFSDMMAKRYPRIAQYVVEYETEITDGQRIRFPTQEAIKLIEKITLDEGAYWLFRIYNSDIICLNDCIDMTFIELQYQNTINNLLIKESEIGDDEIRFTDGNGTEVFKSKLFEKFVKKQKQALAEHLHVEVEKLSEIYNEVMTIHECDDGFGFHGSAFGLVPAALLEMMWLHGGNGKWLESIQSRNRKNKFAYGYRPDFDKLFEKYCRASVRIDYQVFMKKENTFTPIMLSRNCSFVDLEVLAISIGYLYMADCLYQLYIQMQKQYYEDFSWEKFHNKNMKARYESIISDLKESLSVREHQLQSLRQLYSSLKLTLEKKNNLSLLNEQKEKERLLKINEDKDAEIEHLKAIIASQDQMIEQLQATSSEKEPEDDPSRFDVDLENIIYQYKYLFVGDITLLHLDELRRRFPSSIFMNTSTMNISQIQVDVVIYLIQAMGHSMFYKCKNTSNLQDIKTIFYNGHGNLTALLETMERELLK